MSSSKTSISTQKEQRGFSLIELIVSMAIIVLLTSVAIARYQAFDSVVLLRNLAYEVALSVREAQTLGVSVRGAEGNFGYGYGVHFEKDATDYTLFWDENDDREYDPGEEVTVFTIGNGNYVSSTCYNAGSGDDCTTYSIIDVTFKRPEPDAIFSPVPGAQYVFIELESQTGRKETVRIWPTGQVSVDRNP